MIPQNYHNYGPRAERSVGGIFMPGVQNTLRYQAPGIEVLKSISTSGDPRRTPLGRPLFFGYLGSDNQYKSFIFNYFPVILNTFHSRNTSSNSVHGSEKMSHCNNRSALPTLFDKLQWKESTSWNVNRVTGLDSKGKADRSEYVGSTQSNDAGYVDLYPTETNCVPGVLTKLKRCDGWQKHLLGSSTRTIRTLTFSSVKNGSCRVNTSPIDAWKSYSMGLSSLSNQYGVISEPKKRSRIRKQPNSINNMAPVSGFKPGIGAFVFMSIFSIVYKGLF